MVKKASTAAQRVVKAGLVGAAAAVKTGLNAAGVSVGTAAATVAAVSLAALGGWFLGKGILERLDQNSEQQVLANAAVRANHARRALAEELGVYDPDAPGIGLTMDQQKGIRQAYNEAVSSIKQFGRDRGYVERVRNAVARGEPIPPN